MASISLPELAKRMRDIDFTMLTTKTVNGALASRPMSNNGQVEYEGDSHFFTHEDAGMIGDIERDPQVGLTLSGAKGLLGKPPLFVAMEGKAELIRDKEVFKSLWVEDLDRWFEQGIDTPGIVLIKVHADRLHYWDGEDEGELQV